METPTIDIQRCLNDGHYPLMIRRVLWVSKFRHRNVQGRYTAMLTALVCAAHIGDGTQLKVDLRQLREIYGIERPRNVLRLFEKLGLISIMEGTGHYEHYRIRFNYPPAIQ